MFFHPRNLTGTLIVEPTQFEDLIRADYEATHLDDTFDDFKRRTAFDKHDKGLMKSWLALAADRHANKLHFERQIEGSPSDCLLALLDNVRSV